MGPSPAPGGRTVNWDQPLDPSTYTVDFNGWYPDGQFHFGTGATGNNYPNFTAVQAGGLYEAHGRLLGASIFASGLTAPPSYMTALTPTDGTLAPGSDAIDHAMTIPNVTDGYSGAAPDLGAQETGCPVPIYGVRPEGVDESNEPMGCGGPANPADAGASGNDAGFAVDSGGTDGGATGPNGDGGGTGSKGDGGATATAPGSTSGCGCRAIDAGSTPRMPILGAFAWLALIAVRRGRRRDAIEIYVTRASAPRRASACGLLGSPPAQTPASVPTNAVPCRRGMSSPGCER
jgi:MYXO-CTERM domain-containing protein